MKGIKRLLSLVLLLALLVGLLPMTALAAGETKFPLDNEGQLVADDDTLFITLIEQQPGTDRVTATTYIENNNTMNEAIMLDIVGTELTFTDQVAPYNTNTDTTYSGGALTSKDCLDGYYDLFYNFNEISPEMIRNDATGRYISSVVGISDRSQAIVIPAGASQDIIAYHFELTSGSELDLDTFSYAYEYYGVWDALTFFGLGNRLVLTNNVKNSGQQDYVITDDTFKIHVKHLAPEGLSANNADRAIIGYDEDTMEWAFTEEGPYLTGEPQIGNGAQTIYVRMQGDEDYRVENDPEYGNYRKYVESDPVAVDFVYSAGVVAEKENDRDPVEPTRVGDTVGYTITVTNTGTVTAENVTVHDNIAVGVDLLENTVLVDGATPGYMDYDEDSRVLEVLIGDMDPGDVAVVTFQVVVNEEALEQEHIKNTGWITSDEGEEGEFDDDDEREIEPKLVPDLKVSKTSDRAETTRVGDEVTYTIHIDNTDGTAPAYNVVITDELHEALELISDIEINGTAIPAADYEFDANGDLIIKVGTVEAGDVYLVTFTVLVTEDALGENIQNVGTVTGSTEDGGDDDIEEEFDDDRDDPVEDKLEPRLDVDKTSNRAETTRVNDVVTYTITIDNTRGTAPAYNVVVTDELHEALQLIGAVRLNGSDLSDGDYGFDSAGNLVIQIGTVENGQVYTVEFDVRVTEEAEGEVIRNVGTVTGSTEEDGDQDVEEEFDDGREDEVDSRLIPHINVDKTLDRTPPVRVNDTLTYTITVQNTGDDIAYDVVVVDDLPANVAYVPNSANMPSGATVEHDEDEGTLTFYLGDLDNDSVVHTITFQVVVQPEAEGTIIENTGLLTAFYDEESERETDVPEIAIPFSDENNTEEVLPRLVPVLTAEKTSDRGTPVRVEDVITYTITVDNVGDAAAYDVVVEDYISEYVDLDLDSITVRGNAAVEGDDYTYENGVLTLYLGNVGINNPATITFSVEVLKAAQDNTIQNFGEATGYYEREADRTPGQAPDMTVPFEDDNTAKVENKETRTITGLVNPVVTNSRIVQLPEIYQLYDITVELRPTYQGTAAEGLSTVAVTEDAENFTARFTIEDVPFGTYILYIERPGFLARGYTVVIDEDTPDVWEILAPGEDEDGVFILYCGAVRGAFTIEALDVIMLSDMNTKNMTIMDDDFDARYDLNGDGRIDTNDVIMASQNTGLTVMDYPGMEDVNIRT